MTRLTILLVALLAAPASAVDDAHRARAEEMIGRAVSFLREQQHESGGWGVSDRGPALPAITGLVLTGMLDDPRIDAADPSVARGAEYILAFRRDDGGIYDQILPSYNTAICLSALARLDTPEAKAAIEPAQRFLRGLQYGEEAAVDGPAGEQTQIVGREHPFYGGIGYGSHSRPDNSNLNFMLTSFQDAGVSYEDPAVRRALVFLQRTQMLDSVNDMPYADGSTQGGFIYSTGPKGDRAGEGEGETKAGMIEETLDDGTKVSRLRAYGSMTYAGFKSYIYARLPRDDERVTAAFGWIRDNYTLEQNPGMGDEGLYYYFVTFARALAAWGEPTIDVPTTDGSEPRDWANDLVDRLDGLQRRDGGFRSVDERWMENDRVLITAYALIALEHAAR